MDPSLKALFKENKYTFIRTPLLQSFDLLQDQISPSYYAQMVKLVTLQGQVDVLRFDNTLSAIQIASERGLNKIFTYEPVYINDLEKLCVNERWGISAESLDLPSKERDTKLLNLLLSLLKTVYNNTFILELSHTEWLSMLLESEKNLIPLKEDIKNALKKKNVSALESLIKPFASTLKNYEDLIFLLTSHGPYENLKDKIYNTAYFGSLTSILSILEDQYQQMPEWSKPLLYLDMAYPAKLSHYNGLYFQGLSLTSNTLLASGGAYQYKRINQSGIGFVIYIEEDYYE